MLEVKDKVYDAKCTIHLIKRIKDGIERKLSNKVFQDLNSFKILCKDVGFTYNKQAMDRAKDHFLRRGFQVVTFRYSKKIENDKDVCNYIFQVNKINK